MTVQQDDASTLTIQAFNSEIVVSELHSRTTNQPLLARQAGVRIGDTLLCINGELFGPFAEVQDVLDILRLSGDYVSMQFRRRVSDSAEEDIDSDQRLVTLNCFVENNVIDQEQVRLTHRMLGDMKHRALTWSREWVAARVQAWQLHSDKYQKAVNSSSGAAAFSFLDLFTGGGATTTSSSAAAGPTAVKSPTQQLDLSGAMSPASPKSSEELLRSSRQPGVAAGTDGPHTSGTTAVASGNVAELRPALSLRILHAEDQAQEYIVYVIWVCDVLTGLEWVVRRRFSEFFTLREVRKNSVIFI